MDNLPMLPNQRLRDIAYDIAIKFNDFNLTITEGRQVMKYLNNQILPYQVDRSLRDGDGTKFIVVKKSILS